MRAFQALYDPLSGTHLSGILESPPEFGRGLDASVLVVIDIRRRRRAAVMCIIFSNLISWYNVD